MFSSKGFIVLGLTFRSVIHFELIFIYAVKKRSNFTLYFYMDIELSQHHLLNRQFSPTELFCTLTENQLTTNLRVYLWILNCIPLLYMSVIMWVLQCLDYYNFLVSCSSVSRIFLLFWVPYIFIWNLRPAGQILQKAKKDCFKSVDGFREYYHLNNIKFSDPWARGVFPFI